MEDLQIENTTAVENELESDSSAALMKECDQDLNIEATQIFVVIFNDELEGFSVCYSCLPLP